ncbi:GIN domain-containing protein [Ulvibacterium sp.]|uniref:GIN domain-containing protein n=1 Tax=Ulvibacterium sp. TaxID=2665914 RepID=UPI003BA87E2A
MKYNFLVALVMFTGFVHAQRKPKIKGNRSVVQVNENLSPFHAIRLIDDLEIVLKKSFEEGYTIEADDNLIDVLKFEVEDGTLLISSFYKITAKKKLEITINYKELESIIMENGKINTQDVISSDELSIKTSGPSRLELNANATITHLAMEGISSGDFNFASDSIDVQLKDRIDARIYVVGESTHVSMQKNATARLEGTTDSLQVNLYGNANLKAERCEATSVKAFLEESSNANIYALTNFELSSKGSSRVNLYGNPKIGISEFLDTSKLHKAVD